jgi:hypothetical protein
MEKKIKVQIGERTVRIMPHMMKDVEKFGATTEKRVLREVPKELIKSVNPLPKMTEVKPVLNKPPEEVRNLTETKADLQKPSEPDVTEKKVRKSPVRSKAKK